MVDIAKDGLMASQVGPDNISQWLSENMGISSEDIFKATACVNQGSITHIEDSIEAIKRLHDLGMKVVMLTGDSQNRALLRHYAHFYCPRCRLLPVYR